MIVSQTIFRHYLTSVVQPSLRRGVDLRFGLIYVFGTQILRKVAHVPSSQLTLRFQYLRHTLSYFRAVALQIQQLLPMSRHLCSL